MLACYSFADIPTIAEPWLEVRYVACFLQTEMLACYSFADITPVIKYQIGLQSH
jgi:hypothetical protein